MSGMQATLSGDVPLISVYVTNHNYARFLSQCVNSVLDQSVHDYELIIIDDGSTDNSREIIESFGGIERIRIIYQEKRGLNITNNIALRVARGKYIMRLDADDYLDKNALLVLSSALESDSSLGLVFPDYYLVDDLGHILGLERRHDFDKSVSLFDQPAHGACTMIRRQALLEVGGYDESFTCQDGYDLWMKFIDRYRVSNINLPLFYYRQHGDNLTKDERRILSTRTDIKRAHVERNKKQLCAVAVVAVRGKSVDPSSIALEMLGEERVVDRLIRTALASHSFRCVVVTSSDSDIRAHVQQRWRACSDVVWMDRSEAISRLNVGIRETLLEVLKNPVILSIKPDALTVVSENYPLIEGRYLDDAVHTMALFDVDKVVSVRPETTRLYQHDGNGLHMILDQERFTRLERECLYRSAGGVTAFRVCELARLSPHANLRVGHVVVDQRGAHGVFTELDLAVARFLVSGEASTSPV